MPSESTARSATRRSAPAYRRGITFLSLLVAAVTIAAQVPGTPPSQSPSAPQGPALPSAQSIPNAAPASAPSGASNFQGSITEGAATAQTIDLTLDDAIQRGLRNNLGVILSGTQTASARGQRLSQLQNLLPTVNAHIQESEMQSDLAPRPALPQLPHHRRPLRIHRYSRNSRLVRGRRQFTAPVPRLRHDFRASQLSADDARQLVILTVGNAYLLVVADETQVLSVQAEVATAKISLDQAVDSHQAGTAPLLDELRARVDYQSLEQQLIASQNALEKDRLTLDRTIGLPLGQKFNVVDKEPYRAFDQIDLTAALQQAHLNRKDLQAMMEQTKAAQEMRKAATADRYPVLSANGDYGDIGVNVRHSHGTVDGTGQLSVPVFKEYELRGEAEQAQAQLDNSKAQLSDLNAQVDADVCDALLDIQSAQKQVEVAQSSVELANEALTEAQQRFVAGVSDNLPVSQAEQSLAQANLQYVSSLYRHNIAKLSLARALGAAENYKSYLGGK